jgi:phosphohistidine phosphatase
MKLIFILLLFIQINCQGKLIDKIPTCIISDMGRFKYIQIRVKEKNVPSNTKIIIRGTKGLEYHFNIFMQFLNDIQQKPEIYNNFEFEPIGGGFINIDKTSINIFGYSSGYGKAVHKITASILSSFYPNHKITYDERLIE